MNPRELVPSELEKGMSRDELAYWMRFATKVAVKHVGRSVASDPEVLSIAGRAFLRAIRTYDESRKVPLWGWIAFLVRRALNYNLRRRKRLKQIAEHVFWERVPDTRDETETPAWDALEGLSEFDREVVKLYWVDGLTVKQIAARFPGTSAKRLGTYLGKLRARLWTLREKLMGEHRSSDGAWKAGQREQPAEYRVNRVL